MRRVPLAILFVLLAASCGEGTPAFDSKSVQLVVEMRDYSITLNVQTVKAGTAKIGVRNLAAQLHDLVVLKTDLPQDKLPQDTAQQKVIETGKAGSVNVEAQRSAALTVTLEPGSYVLICNVAGHYQLGMHVALKVEP